MLANAMSMVMVLNALRRREEAAIPEPEFKPFVFPRKAAEQAELVPANSASEARTLSELGVPGPLARELEGTLRALGMTDGDRVKGFRFRTLDGAVYALRDGSAPAPAATKLAA